MVHGPESAMKLLWEWFKEGVEEAWFSALGPGFGFILAVAPLSFAISLGNAWLLLALPPAVYLGFFVALLHEPISWKIRELREIEESQRRMHLKYLEKQTTGSIEDLVKAAEDAAEGK